MSSTILDALRKSDKEILVVATDASDDAVRHEFSLGNYGLADYRKAAKRTASVVLGAAAATLFGVLGIVAARMFTGGLTLPLSGTAGFHSGPAAYDVDSPANLQSTDLVSSTPSAMLQARKRHKGHRAGTKRAGREPRVVGATIAQSDPRPSLAPMALPSPPTDVPRSEAPSHSSDETPAMLDSLFQEPVVLDGGVSIEVVDGQFANVTGEATSVRSVIEEICRQAGITLRTYNAPDRRYIGRLRNVPLADAFRSILRSESYLIGLRPFARAGHADITWLRVLGPAGGAAATPVLASVPAPLPTRVTPTSVPRAARNFALPSTLLSDAFGTSDSGHSEEARREVLKRITEPEQRARFLATETLDIANIVGRYEHAAKAVRSMMALTDAPDLQAKLEEILKALGGSDEDVEGTN